MENIIFELITPPDTWSREKIDNWILQVKEILQKHEMAYLNLPEVVKESREHVRTIPYTSKLDNFDFMELIKKNVHGLSFIPNKICVRVPREEFDIWVDATYERGIRNIVIVGGEHGSIVYPGYPVTDAVYYTKQRYSDITIGGITIFTRPQEVTRIMKKLRSGVDFLVSQIIFETANMKQVILSLWRACQEEKISFPKLYISLAPASCVRDIDFMKWLGVEFPSAIASYLCEEGDCLVAEHTFEVLERILDEIYHFMKTYQIPLGFNIEHVMYSNLSLADKLLSSIKARAAV